MKVKIWKILGLILITIFALSTMHSVSAMGVIATIPVVGTSPGDYGVAYDSSKGEVYVTNEGVATVSVISDSSNSVVATIPVRFFPLP
jgi:YVTN family beta-propeller protein